MRDLCGGSWQWRQDARCRGQEEDGGREFVDCSDGGLEIGANLAKKIRIKIKEIFFYFSKHQKSVVKFYWGR